MLASMVFCLWKIFPAPCNVWDNRAVSVSQLSEQSQGTWTCLVAGLVYHTLVVVPLAGYRRALQLHVLLLTNRASVASFLIIAALPIKYRWANKETLNSSLCHSATCSAKILCQDPLLAGCRLLLHTQEVQISSLLICWIVGFVFVGSAVGLYNGKGKIIVWFGLYFLFLKMKSIKFARTGKSEFMVVSLEKVKGQNSCAVLAPDVLRIVF